MVFAISYVHLGYVLHLLLFNESVLHYLSIVLPWWCFVFAWIITVLLQYILQCTYDGTSVCGVHMWDGTEMGDGFWNICESHVWSDLWVFGYSCSAQESETVAWQENWK